MNKPTCQRCGEVAESYNFDAQSSFWGAVKRETETSTQRSIRVLGVSVRYEAQRKTHSDDSFRLCVDCWGYVVNWLTQKRPLGNTE